MAGDRGGYPGCPHAFADIRSQEAALPASQLLEPKKQKPVGHSRRHIYRTNVWDQRYQHQHMDVLRWQEAIPRGDGLGAAGPGRVLGAGIGEVIGRPMVCTPSAVELSLDEVVGGAEWSCSCSDLMPEAGQQ
jgi:hypothetical protein